VELPVAVDLAERRNSRNAGTGFLLALWLFALDSLLVVIGDPQIGTGQNLLQLDVTHVALHSYRPQLGIPVHGRVTFFQVEFACLSQSLMPIFICLLKL